MKKFIWILSVMLALAIVLSACGAPARPRGDAARANYPGARTGRPSGGSPRVRSLLGLAPGGVCHAVAVASPPVRFYRTLSPLPAGFTPT